MGLMDLGFPVDVDEMPAGFSFVGCVEEAEGIEVSIGGREA